ncbi:MAG: carboxypeptidase-like regulatory domain-containing protein, partial [Bacteroidota bacterium]|nr:carboxypeptidase-like regulatory domain-containing protein [Bacteroidota bacterium]
MTKILFFSVFCLAAFASYSQSNQVIKGTLKDSITHQPLPFASITNMNTHQTVLSDKNGYFKISISLNHLLSVASVGYNFDTLLMNEKNTQADTLHIFLSPLTRSLAEVTVYGKIKLSAYQLDSIKRRKDFFETMGEHTLPVFSNANSGAGIGLNLDHFYNREKRKRKTISLFDLIEQEQYINYRFTPVFIAKYTSLSNDSLETFMQQYRPSYYWLRKHTEEDDIIYYI